MVGSPDTMIRRIRTLYERCGIGHLLMMNQAGTMPDQQVRRSLELFVCEVYPAICDLGEHPAHLQTAPAQRRRWLHPSWSESAPGIRPPGAGA